VYEEKKSMNNDDEFKKFLERSSDHGSLIEFLSNASLTRMREIRKVLPEMFSVYEKLKDIDPLKRKVADFLEKSMDGYICAGSTADWIVTRELDDSEDEPKNDFLGDGDD